MADGRGGGPWRPTGSKGQRSQPAGGRGSDRATQSPGKQRSPLAAAGRSRAATQPPAERRRPTGSAARKRTVPRERKSGRTATAVREPSRGAKPLRDRTASPEGAAARKPVQPGRRPDPATRRGRDRRPPERARLPARPRPARPPRAVRLADPRKRLRASLLLLGAVLSLLVGRLVQLQGIEASTYAEMARSSRMQVVSVPAIRGPILDRNGAPLAQSVEAYDIVADPQVISEEGNPAAYALQLEALLDTDASVLQRELTGDARYRVIATNVTPQTWRKISELGLTGIYSEPTQKRIYPGEVGGNVVGFVGAEGTGLAGLELARQEQLSGTDGELVYQVAGGVHVPLGGGGRESAVPGQGLRLTLDRDIQWRAEQAIAEVVSSSAATAGNVVVMDVRTGEILALAAAPLLDPTDPGEQSAGSGGNPAVEAAYEPGSVLKPLSMAAVIEEGKARPETVFSVPDHITRADRTIRDYYNHPEQPMTLAGILAKSSNVGTIMATERLGPEEFGSYLRGFGLGAAPGLGLPAETGGRLPEDWSALDRDFASFGQGISVNTVHLASAYATIAAGGVRYPPRLVDATVDQDGGEEPVPVKAPERVISEAAAEQVTRMMEAVMGPDGTGESVQVDGYRVAGKTGTAQRIDPACGCYNGKVNVSFVGFAPADEPRYAVAVSILDPSGGGSGSRLAGPVFSEVMSFTLRTTGVAPSGESPPDLPLFAD